MTVTGVLAVYAAIVSSLALLLGLALARRLRVAGAPPTAAHLTTAYPTAAPPTAAHAPVAGHAAPPAHLPRSGPRVGGAAPAMSTVTTSGRSITGADLAGDAYLVAFFSSTCRGCRLSLPRFVRYAGAFAGAPERVVAVIVGDAERGADIAAEVAEVASVVTEPATGALTTAYEISLFPTYVLVDGDGVVVATGQSVEELPHSRQPRQARTR